MHEGLQRLEISTFAFQYIPEKSAFSEIKILLSEIWFFLSPSLMNQKSPQLSQILQNAR